eukprot:scaffold659_cov329-Prasinococcus_capsulatus_cf.AAC.17
MLYSNQCRSPSDSSVHGTMPATSGRSAAPERREAKRRHANAGDGRRRRTRQDSAPPQTSALASSSSLSMTATPTSPAGSASRASSANARCKARDFCAAHVAPNGASSRGGRPRGGGCDVLLAAAPAYPPCRRAPARTAALSTPRTAGGRPAAWPGGGASKQSQQSKHTGQADQARDAPHRR